MSDDELPRGPVKPIAPVIPIRDRAVQLRQKHANLSDAQLPPGRVDALTAVVEQRRAKAAAERTQGEIERKASLVHKILLVVGRKPSQDPEANDRSRDSDELTPRAVSRQTQRAGTEHAREPELVHPFDSDTFQKLSNSEKLLALNEMESRLSVVEHRTPIEVVAISMGEAARDKWPADETIRYSHEELKIAIRSDLLEAKDERDLLLRVFQKQKEAEQHAFREQYAQQNHHSEAAAKRMEMIQNALATSKQKSQTNQRGTLGAENPLEKEQREYAVQLLRAYELQKVRSG